VREKNYKAWLVDRRVWIVKWLNNHDRIKMKFWEKIIVKNGWEMTECVWRNGGMRLAVKGELLGEKHYWACVVDQRLWMEKWWNDTDKRNWNTERKNYMVWVVDGWMWLKQWCNDPYIGNLKSWW
jgi:hypothetical protein